MVRGDGRVTYTRRHAYHTLSNKAKVVKTPGGKLVAQYHKKSAKGPRCGDCGISLPGVSRKTVCRGDFPFQSAAGPGAPVTTPIEGLTILGELGVSDVCACIPAFHYAITMRTAWPAPSEPHPLQAVK